MIKVLFTTSRSAVIEIDDGGIYNTKCRYDLLLNGRKMITSDKVITSLYGLEPDTEYTIDSMPSRLDDKAEAPARASALSHCSFRTLYESFTMNVRDFGAAGDGIHNDTQAIQAAVMSCPRDGRVLIPCGTYRITCIFLKSSISVELAKGAVLSACTDKNEFPVLPGLIEGNDEKSEYNLASWEGNPLSCYAGIITGINIHDTVIYGEGTIDGNASEDSWWADIKHSSEPFRPRMLFLNHCRNITVQGMIFRNSPSWAVHPYFSDDLRFYGTEIFNPPISPNTDGLNPESCSSVEIAGLHFSLGDDCIAVKSGKIYMGMKYHTPCRNITIRQCLMENGHGAVTVGSEVSGGITDLTVKECIFRSTDRGLRIKTRRGRGSCSVIDNIVFSNIQMENVMSPLTANSFYFCDPDGHTSYVQNREKIERDERTPQIKHMIFKNMFCNECHVCAAYFEGLPEAMIEEIILENVHISFAAECTSDVPVMADGIKPCSRQGFFFSNIKTVIMKNVTVDGQDGPVYTLNNVDDIQKIQETTKHDRLAEHTVTG